MKDQVRAAARDLAAKTHLFTKPWTSFDEAMAAVQAFTAHVENQDRWRVINHRTGQPFASEAEDRYRTAQAAHGVPPQKSPSTPGTARSA